MEKARNVIVLLTSLVITWVMFIPSGIPEAYAENVNATIISKKVILKQPGRYIGWPTIVKTNNNELLVVFSGDRDAHRCPWGKNQMVRSSDNGKKWSEPVIVNNSPLDDRDAGIIETKEGTLLLSWFSSLAFELPLYSDFRLNQYPDEMTKTWKRHADKLSPETRERWLGSWVRRSVDNGKTWGNPIKIPAFTPHGPIQLRDGRLLYVGRPILDENPVIAVLESHDDGRSWKRIGTVPIPSDDNMENFHEPHVVENEDGKLIVMIRYRLEPRVLKQSESTDGGRTWTVAHDTPLWGYPPQHLLRLRDGRILVAYGHRREPFGERACVSFDGGVTWDAENIIEIASSPTNDLGYPASVELDDGSIYTVYYQPEIDGETPCLMGTHWRLE